MQNNEALKAVSARVRKAFALIDSGRIDQGRRVIEHLIKVLPEPDEKNTRAAKHGG